MDFCWIIQLGAIWFIITRKKEEGLQYLFMGKIFLKAHLCLS